MQPNIQYPDIVLPRLRYQFCPMCSNALTRQEVNDDGITRVICPACGWVHFPTNATGVNLVIRSSGGIVAILPHGEPKDAPAALPGGHVEYAESPEQAAIREAREETGIIVKVIRCLGWYFDRNPSYPGPMLSFVFELQAIGGTIKDSQEGKVEVFPLDRFPAISPNRKGSRRAMEMFLAQP
jgi:ADP-ribose pyrophosphatase YjhB (NUDIX family)